MKHDELPPSKPTEDDMEAGLEIAHATPGCLLKTQGDCNFAARLAERERQLKSALNSLVVVSPKDVDVLIAAATALGQWGTIRDSSDETLNYWKNRVEECRLKLTTQPAPLPSSDKPYPLLSDEWLEKLAPGVMIAGRVQSAHMAQELQQWRKYGKQERP